MALKRFQFHEDPGHGWIKVTLDDIVLAGLTPNDFSTCSYQAPGGVFYLEEDCDAPKFVEAYSKATKRTVCYQEICTNDYSPIRSLDRLSH